MKSKIVYAAGLLLGLMISMSATANGGGHETPPPKPQPASTVNNNHPEANADANAAANAASNAAANATTGPVTVSPTIKNDIDLANQNHNDATAIAHQDQGQAQQQTLENRNTLNTAANASNSNNVHTGDTNVRTGDVNTRVDNDVNNNVKNNVDVNISGPVVHGGAGGAGGQGGRGGEGGDANSHSNSSVGNVSATGGNATGGSATGGTVSGSGNSTNDNHSTSSSSSGVSGSGNSAVSITYQAPKTYKPIPGVAYAAPVSIPNEAIIAVKGTDETKMRAQIELALNELAPFSAERVLIKRKKGESGTSDVSWDLRGAQSGVKATALIPMSLKDARFSTASYRVLSIGRVVGRVSKADQNSVTSNVSDLYDSALQLRDKGYFRGAKQVFMVLIPCLLRVDEGTASTGMSAGGNAGSAHAAGSTVNSIAGALGLGKGSTMQTERSVVYAVVVTQADPSDALSVTFQQLGGVVGSLSTPSGN